MLEKYVPDKHYQSIFRIDYKKLLSKGIELLIFDLDNTIAPITDALPSKEVINLMFELKDMGFTCVLMTNAKRKRAEAFRNALEIDSCAKAGKPFAKNYKKILAMYKKEPEKVAAIGDQLLTDILGANKQGITSILVNPICPKEYLGTRINRRIEKRIYKKLEKMGLYSRKKYYE